MNKNQGEKERKIIINWEKCYDAFFLVTSSTQCTIYSYLGVSSAELHRNYSDLGQATFTQLPETHQMLRDTCRWEFKQVRGHKSRGGYLQREEEGLCWGDTYPCAIDILTIFFNIFHKIPLFSIIRGWGDTTKEFRKYGFLIYYELTKNLWCNCFIYYLYYIYSPFVKYTYINI